MENWRGVNMKEKVAKIIEEINGITIDDYDKDLLATGIIDSFDIVNLVVELEDAFDIEIDVELVIPENFKSVSVIAEMIEKIIE